MTRTKIEYCDTTWNPITGCNRGCEYCYARGIANRFGGHEGKYCFANTFENPYDGPVSLDKPLAFCRKSGRRIAAPYPYGFDPTFHRYRLGDPAKLKKPSTIFVGSMADMFGDWVPDEWIQAVFDACAAAPQHRYLFLTKNPERYTELYKTGILPEHKNFWFGSTATTPNDPVWWSDAHNAFVSIEPILAEFDTIGGPLKISDWVIIGAETGNRKDKVRPERGWVENIVAKCRESDTPVFMKNSLAAVWGEPLIQEFPWEE